MQDRLLPGKINSKMFFIDEIKTDKTKYKYCGKTNKGGFKTGLHPFITASDPVLTYCYEQRNYGNRGCNRLFPIKSFSKMTDQ